MHVYKALLCPASCWGFLCTLRTPLCSSVNQCMARLSRRGVCRRAGILVLVNDVDWELTGELQTEVADGDSVVFISTLHGG